MTKDRSRPGGGSTSDEVFFEKCQHPRCRIRYGRRVRLRCSTSARQDGSWKEEHPEYVTCMRIREVLVRIGIFRLLEPVDQEISHHGCRAGARNPVISRRCEKYRSMLTLDPHRPLTGLNAAA